MLILSLNIRGVGGPHKKCALGRLVSSLKPDIILLQETMAESCKAIDFMSGIVGNWFMSAIDAVGLFGGLLLAWDPKKASFDAFNSYASISLQGRIVGDSQIVKVVNVYGPYVDRIPF